MNARDLSRPHVFEKKGQKTLLLLHGTGADEHDLLRLGAALLPEASLLSPRGMVNENGMNRFFERRADGSFVQESVLQAVDELNDFLVAARAEYGIQDGLLAVGFSNGANTAAALQVIHPNQLSGAVMFGSTKPLEVVPEVDLTGKRMWIANGVNDPYAPESVTEAWVAELRELGATVSWLSHPGGHQISPAHMQEISRELA
ncbi:MAG: alpha/beta hydrolase [Aquiluna sp.]|nr:alpha/beta hydrolase [Aquiluna sp.]